MSQSLKTTGENAGLKTHFFVVWRFNAEQYHILCKMQTYDKRTAQ